MTVVSLAMLRIHSYAVNGNDIPFDERGVYAWSSMLWVTSFHGGAGNTVLQNKRNIVLETVGLLTLITRDDVSQLRCATTEGNEHTHGMWRGSRREFRMEELIQIVQKSEIKVQALFESNLVTARSKSSFKGYSATFGDYLLSLKSGSRTSGNVEVDLGKPAISQLWEEMKGIIAVANSFVLPFLEMFGAVEGNGLSPFARNFDSPNELKDEIEKFFRRQKPDRRGRSVLATEDMTDDDESMDESKMEDDKEFDDLD